MRLSDIRADGFDVALTERGTIAISPPERLDDECRAWIRQHRAELVEELRAERVVASTEPLVRGKLDAYAALLEQYGYGGHPTRLPARLRRNLARAAGGASLRAIRDDAEAWRRASKVVDGWITLLAADVHRGPLA